LDLESEYDAAYAAFLAALRKKTLVRVGMEARARVKPSAKPRARPRR
jgi:hypothetical protein